jgi:hypothetical protein
MLRPAFLLSLALLPVGPTPDGGGAADSPQNAPATELSDPYHQGIFFAVLEGLYRDGVSSEVARAITAVDPQSLQPSSFVPGCPICMPALDAFLLYLERPPFRGKKLARDTFGAGLPAEQVARLSGPDGRARRAALRDLVQRWVYEHLDRLRLDPVERGAWTRELAARPETGMAILAGLQKSGDALYGDFDECPLCLGAEAGSVAGG